MGGIDLPPGAAITVVQDLIDDDRNRADLLTSIAQTLDTLAKTLDTRQAAMLNRHVLQAVRDSLGAG